MTLEIKDNLTSYQMELGGLENDGLAKLMHPENEQLGYIISQDPLQP